MEPFAWLAMRPRHASGLVLVEIELASSPCVRCSGSPHRKSDSDSQNAPTGSPDRPAPQGSARSPWHRLHDPPAGCAGYRCYHTSARRSRRETGGTAVWREPFWSHDHVGLFIPRSSGNRRWQANQAHSFSNCPAPRVQTGIPPSWEGRSLFGTQTSFPTIVYRTCGPARWPNATSPEPGLSVERKGLDYL